MADATILDRGYRRFAGPRLGLAGALWTMLWTGMLRTMGVRRPARTKIMPWLLFAVAWAPAAFLLTFQAVTHLGAASLTRSGALYSGYYSGIALVLVLFVSLAAPDLLCSDRRDRVISLYFVAPITRVHYLGTKLGALVGLLLLLTAVPATILFAGLVLLDRDSGAYLSAHLGDLWRLLAGGGVLSVYDAALAMAVASFTDRRVYAGGATVGLLLISSVASGILSRGMHFEGHERFALIDLLNLPIETVRWIFGEPLQLHLEGWAEGGMAGLVVMASILLLCWQYRRVPE
ncbi:MAG: hypothetical protein JOZ41_15180 [Chloroflexi bacterium]|nr:hypothetical protein [Chloroflexota bacterium]